MSSEETGLEVFAWVADVNQAQNVTEEEVERFRNILGAKLAIERRRDGTLVLFTSDEDVKQRLDTLMHVLGIFREQKIYIRRKTV